MCTSENCIEDENVDTERRSFLTGATVAAVSTALGIRALGQQQPQPPTGALTDREVIQAEVSFKNGRDTIGGYLARHEKRAVTGPSLCCTEICFYLKTTATRPHSSLRPGLSALR
jgi:hypothetical protein